MSYASSSHGFDNNSLNLDYNHGNTSADNRNYDFGIFRETNNNYITNNYPSSCPTGQKDCWHTKQSKTSTDVSHWCVGNNENC